MNQVLTKVDSGMSTLSAERTAVSLLCVLGRLGYPVSQRTKLLEIGCGNGELVNALRNRGIDAFGCDLQFKNGPRTAAMHEGSLLKLIERDPYRLPFKEASFDLIVSISVLEHVMNLGETIQEMSRVTRRSGGGLHIFPSRYRLIEPHTYIPLGTLLRMHWWLRLWALLGVKNSFQMHLKSAQVAEMNYAYLHESTSYLSRSNIQRAFQKEFAGVTFCEDLFVSCATGSLSNRVGMGRILQSSTMLTRLFSATRGRVIWVQKSR